MHFVKMLRSFNCFQQKLNEGDSTAATAKRVFLSLESEEEEPVRIADIVGSRYVSPVCLAVSHLALSRDSNQLIL